MDICTRTRTRTKQVLGLSEGTPHLTDHSYREACADREGYDAAYLHIIIMWSWVHEAPVQAHHSYAMVSQQP